MPSFPDLSEPLDDGVVAVRRFVERDIPEILIAFEDDPELHLRLGIERPPSGADLGRRAEAAEHDRRAGTHLAFTVTPSDSDVCVGHILTAEVEWQQARVELGMFISPQVRGRGFGPRALRMTARWLIEFGRFERVQLITEPDNARMLGAARSAGFQEEGVLRAYTLERGQRVNCTILSLLPSDLAAGRAP